VKQHPVGNVIWVDLDKVKPNDYNPNSVAKQELELLYHSISQDGYTQPVVTVRSEVEGEYTIVDGFHRYFVCKNYPDIFESTNGKLPIVVIEATMGGRIGATVRHNRARGKHSPMAMANLVFSLSELGHSEEDISRDLGTSLDEIKRLRHVTGFSKLFENAEYSRSWRLRAQVLKERDAAKKLGL
jgi:ParB-like chromosome segregation protein Spo0J